MNAARSMRTLNVGAVIQRDGDVRVDAEPSPSIDVQCDAEHLPFQDGSFTEVTSVCVLEHLRNPGAAVKEMFRVLAPGGNSTLRRTTPRTGAGTSHSTTPHFTRRAGIGMMPSTRLDTPRPTAKPRVSESSPSRDSSDPPVAGWTRFCDGSLGAPSHCGGFGFGR